MLRTLVRVPCGRRSKPHINMQMHAQVFGCRSTASFIPTSPLALHKEDTAVAPKNLRRRCSAMDTSWLRLPIATDERKYWQSQWHTGLSSMPTVRIPVDDADFTSLPDRTGSLKQLDEMDLAS